MRNRAFPSAALLIVFGLTVSAQDKPAQPAPPPESEPAVAPVRQRADLVPLKVTVVLSRFLGEKKISSLPYVLGVTANSKPTTLRMGIDVPFRQTIFGGEKGAAAQTSFSYRKVGTNIDCVATTAPGGLYQLGFTVADTSTLPGATLTPASATAAQGGAPTEGIAADVPLLRTFNSSFTMVMRDGQSAQYTSATDPVSGEVMKIDVTLNVMK